MKRRGRRIGVLVAAAFVAAAISAAVYIDARVFPLEYLPIKLRPTSVARAEEGTFAAHILPAAGRAVVLEFPDGSFGLIGAGDGTELSYRALLRYCEGLKIRRLRFLALTSSDSGEIGGAERAIEYLGADAVYVAASVRSARQFSAIAKTTARKKGEIRDLSTGEVLFEADGCRVTAYGGGADEAEELPSSVLAVRYADSVSLFAGYATAREALLASFAAEAMYGESFRGASLLEFAALSAAEGEIAALQSLVPARLVVPEDARVGAQEALSLFTVVEARGKEAIRHQVKPVEE